MEYEIDYIPVGQGEKGGDAITFRYWDPSYPENQTVVVIDGGTKESGMALVDHIKRYYGTTYVDLVIASHLHQDHVSGLSEVIENLTVDELAMHLPWDHVGKAKSHKSIASVSDLHGLAVSNGVNVVQKFQGDWLIDGTFRLLGPSREFYKEQLDAEDSFVRSVAREVTKWIHETLDQESETLSDDYPDTSPANNSSKVMLLELNEKKFLFTGDAGKTALGEAIAYSNNVGIDLKNIYFLDVPHHGSKRNLGKSILDHLRPQQAFISCPQDGDPTHPSRGVVNALIRRDCAPCTTRKGNAIRTSSPGAPSREGWGPIDPETFFPQVED